MEGLFERPIRVIFRRAILSELTSAASAVFTVLFSIIISVGLVRILGQAAGGRVDNEAVLQLLALTALIWLPVVFTLTLFIAVLITLSRSYRDSEMVVWFTSGKSLVDWIGPVMRFSWPILIAIALLSIFGTPWAYAQIEKSKERFAKRDDVSRVAPGRFIESSGGNRVFFVESVDLENGKVRNIFISTRSQGREGVVVAAEGRIQEADNGDRFIVLEHGRRYEGQPGTMEYRTLEFDRYSVRLERRPDRPLGEGTLRMKSFDELLIAPTSFAKAEILWRVGIPVLAVLVTLLAIPLSYTNPRVGRSFNLVIAVLAFTIYLNVLNTLKAWVQQDRMDFATALWAPHAVAALIVIALFARRVYLQRLLPRWAYPSNWRQSAVSTR